MAMCCCVSEAMPFSYRNTPTEAEWQPGSRSQLGKDSPVTDGRGTAKSTRGFSVERIASNDAIFREANDEIGETAVEYGVETSIPFLCE
jgi:hypothetical protein